MIFKFYVLAILPQSLSTVYTKIRCLDMCKKEKQFPFGICIFSHDCLALAFRAQENNDAVSHDEEKVKKK